MISLTSLSLLTSLFVSGLEAHSIFQQVWVNGVDQGFEYAMKLPSYDGPQTDVTTTYMTCNGPPNPLVYNSTGIITVAAGSTMTGRWGQYLATDSPSIDPSHKGPIMVYMAAASGNVGTANAPSGGWFKIYQDGLTYSGGTSTWAVDKMIANGGKWSWTVPSCIPNGQYFVRGELIALHAASSYPGAQLYFECAQISVTGGGSASPSTVAFPGAYKTQDMIYNLYAGSTTYSIPGPTVFACPGSGGSTSQPTSTPTTKPTTITGGSTTPTPTTTTTKTTTTGGTCAVLYGQCGGLTFSGPTCCSSGTCTVSSAYYSQCLP